VNGEKQTKERWCFNTEADLEEFLASPEAPTLGVKERRVTACPWFMCDGVGRLSITVAPF
jgi:hypothetical protein